MGKVGFYKKRHRRRKLIAFIMVTVLFWTGFFLAIERYSNLSPLRAQAVAPFTSVFKGQFFFAGEPTALPNFGTNLPQLSEWDGHDTLVRWDVSYTEEEAGGSNIPIFVRTTVGVDDDTTEGEVAPLATTKPIANLAAPTPSDGTVQVIIYSTHTGEEYDGGGTVIDVGNHLAETLQAQYGITAVADGTVHDSPEWYHSYANSRATAESLLEAYPDAKLLVDLHRDSGPSKEDSTMVIDNTSTAKLLLVVGSNMQMNHPNWEQNYATANALGEAIKGVNSDILRGIRVQQGRYNQHLTPNAVLIEIGTDKNTLDEAVKSAEIFAAGISAYFGE